MHQTIPLTDGDLHLAATLGGSVIDQSLLNIADPRNMFSQEALDSCLLTSSRNGHRLMVQLLIKAGANVNILDGQGNTPLMVCAELALVDVVDVLIMKGADINISNVFLDTALHLSVKTSYLNGVTKCLLAQPNINLNCQNLNGETPLIIALKMLNLEAVKLLLENGASANDVFDKNGDDALKISESLGICKIFNYLLNCEGFSPLMKATLARDLECLKFFVRCSFCFVLESERRGENCLNRFLNSIKEDNNDVSETELSIVKELVKAGILKNINCDDSYALISIASDIGDYQIIQMISSNVTEMPYRVIYNAITCGRYDLVSLYLKNGHIQQHSGALLELSLELGELECASLLLQHGAPLDLPKALETALLNLKSKTATLLIGHCDKHSLRHNRGDLLHIAVEKGNLEMVQMFLDSGWDINFVHNMKTPLMHAISHEMITFLLDRKADVNFKTNTTVLLNAVTFPYMSKIKLNSAGDVYYYLGEIVHVFLSHNANVNESDYDGQSPLMAAASLQGCTAIMEQLLRSNALINAQDNDGRVALHHAVLNRNVEGLDVLLSNGADVHVKDHFGATPLNLASAMNPCSKILYSLLRYDSDVNTEDTEGNTAMLNLASHQGFDVELVKLVLDHGADVNHKDKNGRTALFYAMQNLHVRLFKVLLEFGADSKTLTCGDMQQNNPLTFFLHKSRPTKSMLEIAELLCNHGVFEVHHLPPIVAHRLIACNKVSLLKTLICKGLAPVDIKCEEDFLSWPREHVSPLTIALMMDKAELVKFFMSIYFLTESDLGVLYGKAGVQTYLTAHNKRNCLQLINELSKTPLPLTTLSFVKVLSCIGRHDGRLARLESVQLPWTLSEQVASKSEGVIPDEDSVDTDNEIFYQLTTNDSFNS